MKKKGIVLFICMLLVIGIGSYMMFFKETKIKRKDIGVSCYVPKGWDKFYDQDVYLRNKSVEINGDRVMFEVLISFEHKNNPIMDVIAFDMDKIDKEIKQVLQSSYEENVFVGKNSFYEVYIGYNYDIGEETFSKNKKKQRQAIDAGVEKIRKSIEIFEPKNFELDLRKTEGISFESENLNGEKVTSDIFKDYDLTLINVWSTSCGPCKREMPYLEEIFKEKKAGNINILGIVIDGEDEKELAKKIIASKGVTYKNILVSEDMDKGFLKNVRMLPTNFFVDGNGKVVGDILNTSKKLEFEKAIEKALNK